MKYELNQEEVVALKELLSRVTLQGKEVPAYTRILSIFEKPEQEMVSPDAE